MLHLRLVSQHQLTVMERAQIIDLCARSFEEDFSELFTLVPEATHLLATEETALCGHCCWITRWLQPEGLPLLRTAYVEAVAVEPARQRQGIGRALMRRLADEIVGYELAALSAAVPEFYETLGWTPWRGPTAIRCDGGLLETPDEEIMILSTPHTPPLDLTARISAEWRLGDLW